MFTRAASLVAEENVLVSGEFCEVHMLKILGGCGFIALLVASYICRLIYSRPRPTDEEIKREYLESVARATAARERGHIA
jgi:hypothetical protein